MTTYKYEAVSPRGKKLKGNLSAETRDAAVDQLTSAGNIVVSLSEVGSLNRDIKLGIFEPKPKPRDLAVFCRQFVSILGAGVPVISAFEMLGEQTENKVLKNAILESKKTIENGETLANSMAQFPDVFPTMFVTLIEAGEASGSLDISFTRMAEQFEKAAKLSATVKKASIYPVVIGVIAFAAVILLLSFVVPAFAGMLHDLDVPMPALTVAVLAASDFVQRRWYILFAIIVAAVAAIKVFKKTDMGKHFFGKLTLKIPVLSKLVTKTAAARMARTLSTMVGAGLPLMDSLSITANTMSNIWFKEEILKARDQVMVGTELSKQFRDGGLFPPLVHHMIRIGEDTGDLDSMLTKLAEYYEDEVETATEQVMALMEPLIIVVLALVIGSIVMAVILPMASMYDGLNNL